MGRTADIKGKKKSGEKMASSVVFSIKGKKMAQRCLEKGLRGAGVWHSVERYIRAGPDSFCEVCCGWRHNVSKCGRLGMVRCLLCTGSHKTEDHQCNVVGCRAKKGQNCTHNHDKCANCKGNHIAKSNTCPKKQEAIKLAKEERTSWSDRVRGGRPQHLSQKAPKESEDMAPSTEVGEKKVGPGQSEGQDQEPKRKGKENEEIQVPAMQQGSEDSVTMTQW
jgi:hypothetical protein